MLDHEDAEALIRRGLGAGFLTVDDVPVDADGPASIAADDEELKKDLTAVIALNGLPCGKVVAVKVLAENEYNASCEDGNKYHIFVNEAGRVVVEKAK